jgi:hypothetical protein
LINGIKGSGRAFLNDAFATMALEMLGDLVHKGPNGGFPARLKASVIGRIQIGDSSAVHDGLYDGRGGHAGHAGKGVNIDNAIVAFFNKLQDGGDAQTGFGCNIKCKNIFLLEQLFQMAHLMIVFKINPPGSAVVELFLSHFLVEKISAGADDLMKIIFQTTEIQLLEV